MLPLRIEPKPHTAQRPLNYDDISATFFINKSDCVHEVPKGCDRITLVVVTNIRKKKVFPRFVSRSLGSITRAYFRGFKKLEKVEIQLNIMYIQYKYKNSFNKSRNSPNQQRKVLVTNSVT